LARARRGRLRRRLKEEAPSGGHLFAERDTACTPGDGNPQPVTELGSGGVNNSERNFPLQVIEPQYMDNYRCHLQYIDGISFAKLARCQCISGHLKLFGVGINETADHRMGILADVYQSMQIR
jgi:hypothetical protein